MCERRQKCGDLGSQSAKPPAAYWDYIYFWGCVSGPVAGGERGEECVWEAGKDESALSERSSTMITGKCCSFWPCSSYLCERLPKLNEPK